ncbi:hypothetical protein LR48_Vigan10g262900 [Vigna angularis]|uniref:Uncharacterized protein n=1 Tax=Phaseolus angularis TaxID=3914 RepID=A0A0L9VPB1_PHAAN|nr:hypothetical protein LR48_Vigan10g262900 [Vigna angularis]
MATRAVFHRDFRPISPTPQGLTSKNIDTTRNDALYSTRAEVIGRDVHLLAQKKILLQGLPSHQMLNQILLSGLQKLEQLPMGAPRTVGNEREEGFPSSGSSPSYQR